MNIIWRKVARADRSGIFDYVAQDNPVAALELDEEFDTKAELVAKRPNLYRTGRMRGTREVVVRPNYVMVYRVKADTVVILRVLHAAQRWPQAKGT